jgi:hypothetical protein
MNGQNQFGDRMGAWSNQQQQYESQAYLAYYVDCNLRLEQEVIIVTVYNV